MEALFKEFHERAHALAAQFLSGDVNEKAILEARNLTREIEVAIQTYVYCVSNIQRLKLRIDEQADMLCSLRDMMKEARTK